MKERDIERLSELVTKRELGVLTEEETQEMYVLAMTHNIKIVQGKLIVIAPDWMMDILVNLN